MQSKFSEFSDSVKTTIQDFKAEVVQARDAHDAIAQRIAQSEAKASQVDESLRAVGAALQSFEKTASDGLAHAEQQVNSMVSSAALQIAHDLRTETEERERASGDLHARTEEVNQKAAQNVVFIERAISELSQSFSQSLSVLSTSVRDALEATRDESDRRYRELLARYEELLGQIEANFGRVQEESASTITALNDHAIKAREELEAALSQECNTRRQNELQIVQRYDNFKALIINEMQLQTSQMEALSEQSKRKVVERCHELIAPLKAEIAAVRDKTRGAETLPQRAAAIEKTIAQLNAQLIEGVGSIGRQSATVSGKVEKVRAEADQTIDSYNERVRVLEEEVANPDFATRTDVSDAFGRLNSEFEGRMQEIEQQIGVIFSSLSELTMTLPPPLANRQPGAATLEQLVSAEGTDE
jgi:uncharacterized coiled-coil protein SlyX